jgi:IS30 family transposase
MTEKHYAMLGAFVRDLITSGRGNGLSSEEIGRIIARYVETLELEAQRDARDAANGKGN